MMDSSKSAQSALIQFIREKREHASAIYLSMKRVSSQNAYCCFKTMLDASGQKDSIRLKHFEDKPFRILRTASLSPNVTPISSNL